MSGSLAQVDKKKLLLWLNRQGTESRLLSEEKEDHDLKQAHSCFSNTYFKVKEIIKRGDFDVE